MKEQNEIIEMAKKRGLDIAEDSLQALGQLTLDILGHYAEQNKYAKMLWIAVEEELREQLVQLIDKVDGEEG